MGSVRVAIVGVGNCASSLVQGVEYYKNAKDLTMALVPIFNKEMKELVAGGAKYLQIEDLGAWLVREGWALA